MAQGIVDEFVEEYKGKHGDVQYSKRSFSKKDYAKVNDARVEMYRGMDAEDIPNVDYIPVAEYNVVNFFDGLGGVVDAFRTILSVFDE